MLKAPPYKLGGKLEDWDRMLLLELALLLWWQSGPFAAPLS